MKKAILIFQKNAVLGQVKTRLAKDLGDDKALEIYNFLSNYTHELLAEIEVAKFLFYSDFIPQDTSFPENYQLKIQHGNDLGERMYNAFQEVYALGYNALIIIGTDCYELTKEIIEEAFLALQENQSVIGPALDGGYYLLGSTKIDKVLFQNKIWSSETVFSESIKDFQKLNVKYHKLKLLSDIDTVADLKVLKEKFMD